MARVGRRIALLLLAQRQSDPHHRGLRRHRRQSEVFRQKTLTNLGRIGAGKSESGGNVATGATSRNLLNSVHTLLETPNAPRSSTYPHPRSSFPFVGHRLPGPRAFCLRPMTTTNIHSAKVMCFCRSFCWDWSRISEVSFSLASGSSPRCAKSGAREIPGSLLAASCRHICFSPTEARSLRLAIS